MSTEQSHNSNLDFLDEELVAYLDGELDSQATKRLEDLLATDEPARKRLSQLANSWELLDQLPRATVDDLFTRTTVEMVALAEEDEVAKHEAAAPARRRTRWLVGAGAALCAAAIGFVAMALAVPDQNDPLLRDLPVVYNLELYQPIASMDFLRQLQAAELFVKDTGDTTKNASSQEGHNTTNAMTLQRTIPDSISKRRQWVEALSPSEKPELRTDLRFFEDLSPKEQQALREFDHQLRNDPNADELSRVVERFYEWWNTLRSEDRRRWDDETNLQNRIALVHEFQKNQEQDIFDAFYRQRLTLKNSDNQVLLRWMVQHALSHNRELLASMPSDGQRGDAPRIGRGARGQQLMRAFALWWSPQQHTEIPAISETELHALRESLSTEKREELDTAIGKGHYDTVKLIRGWIQTACSDMVAAGRSQPNIFGGRRGSPLPRPGGPRPFVDAPGTREPPAPPDRQDAPRKD